MISKFSPKKDILPKPQQELWPQLSPALDLGFVLYGGTAIALQLGHRESIDFDFFSDKPFDKNKLYKELPFLNNSIVIQDEPESFSVLWQNEKHEEVKLSFFGDLKIGRFNEPLMTEDGVMLVANLDDLMATKLKVVMQRVETKDYRDIAAMLKDGINLILGISIANKMFSPSFSPMHCLKTLQYFEGGDLHLLKDEEKEQLFEAADLLMHSLNIQENITLHSSLSLNLTEREDEIDFDR